MLHKEINMDLVTVDNPATTKITGEQTEITVTAGQSIRIETSPGGEEILESVVPIGKTWTLAVNVNIDETDA